MVGVWTGGCLVPPPADAPACDDGPCTSTTGGSGNPSLSTGGPTGGPTGSSLPTGEQTASGGSGNGTVGPGEFTFTDDAFDGEFGAGQFDGIRWGEPGLELEPSERLGEFSSRIFDAGSDATWLELRWVPDGPYARPLPDDAGVDPEYAGGGIDMAANVLLLHFEGTGSLGDGVTLEDASGLGYDALVLAPTTSPAYVEGVVGSALADTADARLTIPIAGAPLLDFADSDFTWALWAQTTEDCQGTNGSANHAYLGAQGDGSGATHLWLGCLRPNDDSCPAGPATGRVGGTLSSLQQIDGGSYCTTRSIVDGQWHHLALTKSGHPAAEIRIYVDGQREYTGTLSFDGPLSVFGPGGDFRVGALTAASEVTMDEVAVWRRALTDDDILAVFRRGAARIGLQVRSCGDAMCSDSVAFLGPDEDPSALFRDDGEVGSAAAIDFLAARRYFQYRVVFETAHVAADPGSPTLRAVSVTGQH